MSTIWFLIVGSLLILMVLLGTMLQRLPFNAAMIYLAIGFALGPAGLAMIRLDPLHDARLVHVLSEVAVLVSLFSVGLKLRARIGARVWRTPIILATLTMAVTIALLTGFAAVALALPLGAAVLLAAMLAPTDPVLASEVQIRDPADRDQLRFALSAEGGLNDGVAFPFVLLGLGLLGLHDLGPYGVRWIGIDLVWAIAGGIGSGWLAALAIGKIVLHLRRHHHEALGSDEFLALGLIALSYGSALAIHAYGFLAVFTAGLVLRRIERLEPEAGPALERLGGASPRAETDSQAAPAKLARSLLDVNEQMERMVELAVVLGLGIMLSGGHLAWEGIALAAVLLFIIRPLAVLVTLMPWALRDAPLSLVAWFGIRGIGSVYYLMFAIGEGLAPELAERLTPIALTVLAVSIVVHGVSATPLMQHYEARRSRRYRNEPPPGRG